ncbi:MAG: inorganic pyrophosphatase [Chloroflexi bacterium]|nr:inorganic pyrophosphatase [Chloroflexota bacterium]
MDQLSTFWEHIEELVSHSSVVIDRPKDSTHPYFNDLVYPLDYGYLAGTMAVDGGGIDVWLGSENRNNVTGVICAVDLFKRDAEVKILLGCTDDEMRTIERFLNHDDLRCLLIRRGAGEVE